MYVIIRAMEDEFQKDTLLCSYGLQTRQQAALYIGEALDLINLVWPTVKQIRIDIKEG